MYDLEELYVEQNLLSGTIPSELGALTSSTIMFMDRNYLTGPIPSEIGRLLALESIEVYDNMLSKTIPTEIGELSQLQFLDISDNILNGALLNDILYFTVCFVGKALLLTDLCFIATGRLPSEVGRLQSLQLLQIENNPISGELPPALFSSQLYFLIINKTLLQGTIPTEIGLASSLEDLSLMYSQFTGTLPLEIFHLPLLQYFWIQGNAFEGSIPSQLGLLTNLLDLSLDQNSFGSTLPTELGNLRSLTNLYVGNNPQLIGTIPEEVGDLAVEGKLATLDFLGTPMLTGVVPLAVCSLPNLRWNCTANLCGCDCECDNER